MKFPFLRVLAAVEISGGLWGIGAVASATPPPVPGLLYPSLALLAFGASAAAGVLLWRGQPAGWRLSSVVQAAQVLQLLTPVFVWQYRVGPHLTVWLADGHVGMNAGFQMDFALVPPPSGPVLAVALNLLALAALVVLFRLRVHPAPAARRSAAAV